MHGAAGAASAADRNCKTLASSLEGFMRRYAVGFYQQPAAAEPAAAAAAAAASS
jgi:hypothetical protein